MFTKFEQIGLPIIILLLVGIIGYAIGHSVARSNNMESEVPTIVFVHSHTKSQKDEVVTMVYRCQAVQRTPELVILIADDSTINPVGVMCKTK